MTRFTKFFLVFLTMSFMMSPAYSGWQQDILFRDCSKNNDADIKVIKLLKSEFEDVGQQLTTGKITQEQAKNLWAQIIENYSDDTFQIQKEITEKNRKSASVESLELLNLSMKLKHAAVLKTLPLIVRTNASDIRINRIFVEQCELIVQSTKY
jgi:hypothetical protein